MKILKILLLSTSLFIGTLFSFLPALAASITDTGLTVSSSVCTDTLANLTTQGCSSGGFIPITGNNGGLIIAGPLTVNANSTYGNYWFVPLGTIIGHINVSCMSYNAVDASANASHGYGFYNILDSTGLGGATIKFGIANGTYSTASPLVLGTVVIPTSPQAGPWITSVTSAVGTPYTTLAGDAITLYISAMSSATQKVYDCEGFVGP